MNSRLEGNSALPSDDIRQSLLPVFRAEAAERLDAMNAVLAELDTTDEQPRRQALLERLTRHAHSLKGGARAVELPDVERICAGLESALATLQATQLQSATVAGIRAVVALVHDLLQNGTAPANGTRRALHLIDLIAPDSDAANGCRAASYAPDDAGGAKANGAHANPGRGPAAEYSILVADDSMTSRIYVKRLLQKAGYRVTDVCDGMEAIAVLEHAPIDLLVSDVEMPRADGLKLTAWVRAHPQLQQLGVILVSGLEAEADLRRGRQAGANDYIPRSELKESRLLDAVERLLPVRARTPFP